MNILFLTTRSPRLDPEHDGGSTFAAQVIQHLATRCHLDVLFVRERDHALAALDNVRAVHFIPPDNTITNRFERRLSFASYIGEWVREHIGNYDAVLVQHISLAFGLSSLPPTLARKVIVIPMFTSTAYARSGEIVPSEYVEAERKVMRSAGAIICASKAEIDDIRSVFDIPAAKFRARPFGVSVNERSRRPALDATRGLHLLCIASIKRQKNQIDAIAVLEALLARGIETQLLLVGGVADHEYQARIADEISRRSLADRVRQYGAIPKDRIWEVAVGCSVSISVSKWETFGIALFESLSMGIPAVVYDDIPCFWEYLTESQGCIGVRRSPEAMASRVAQLASNPNEYASQSVAGQAAVARFAPRIVIPELLSDIESLTN